MKRSAFWLGPAMVASSAVLMCAGSLMTAAKPYEVAIKRVTAPGDTALAWYRARPIGKPDSLIVTLVCSRCVTQRRAYKAVAITDSVPLKLTPPLASGDSVGVLFILAAKVKNSLTKPDTVTKFAYGVGAAFDSTALTYLHLTPDSTLAFMGDTVLLTRVRRDKGGLIATDVIPWWAGLKPGNLFAKDSGKAVGGGYIQDAVLIAVMPQGRNEPAGFQRFAQLSAMTQLPPYPAAQMPGEIGLWRAFPQGDPDLTLMPDSTVMARRL